ncbi:ExeA family protein [Rhodospirillum rubrum]|uniref:MSHA biogenesis protein MshM n=1 Tax=Rhodospirillum rubrum (strain ATCC 11170 / ATH 1.1.1 / DSM 467 / LMG 4362 / NCIMB 8255 / S1) TaxID=269796 RepID=Q2RY83_RHORT|nr:AAA family ATPase [Rhodospirillum rubrum]ABC20912.1 MSHA biogenesis protein MshM [Rhodospirillum rubrum ATCC 11170]AEO46580.1 MSHA biogenesis protein MshM [Rhodospirillum rubrum F11]MBK5952470.1 MSHA biogenesis protein MshM [Rhodospirillum rubrum]QXG80611.1 AAA family ATPase [Rhodospirillum rubrum]
MNAVDPVLVHFGFHRHPFPAEAGLELAYAGNDSQAPVRRLLARLTRYAGPVTVVGEAGLGKSYLCDWVAALLESRALVVRVNATDLGGARLLPLVAQALDLDPERPAGTSPRVLTARLLALRVSGRRAVLLVDGADALSDGDLEDLRRLDALETARGRLLRVALFGRPGLRERLQTLPQLARRLGPGVRLTPMTRSDLTSYLDHRLAVSRDPLWIDPVFTPAARRRLLRLARGVPGDLDRLASAALYLAAGEGAATVETGHMGTAARALNLGPRWLTLPRLPGFGGPNPLDALLHPLALQARS